jgi:peptidoglycan/LPS O-acetylase OafA/YrhL
MARASTDCRALKLQATPRAVPGAATRASDVPEPSWLRQGRLPSLDGLRALSIGLVLLDHLSRTPDTPLAWPAFHALGAAGVETFFVISGFLITLLLLREERRDGGVSLTGFFCRRVFRIVPAYAAFLLVLFGLQVAGALYLPAISWLRAATYSTSLFDRVPGAWDLSHTWSLAVEEHFYLLWPCLFAVLGRRGAFLAAVGCIAVTPFVRVALRYCLGDAQPEFGFFTPTRMDAIAVGCCLAFLATTPRFRRAARCSGAWPTVVVVITATVVLGLGECLRDCGHVRPLAYVEAFLWSTVRPILLAAIVWLCVCNPTSLVGRLLNGRVLSFIGLISYGIYLWQQFFLNPQRQHWTCGWPAGLASTLLAALLSYFVLERPLLALKDRLSARRRRVVVVSTPAVVWANPAAADVLDGPRTTSAA